jgi:hypothetical protein
MQIWNKILLMKIAQLLAMGVCKKCASSKKQLCSLEKKGFG